MMIILPHTLNVLHNHIIDFASKNKMIRLTLESERVEPVRFNLQTTYALTAFFHEEPTFNDLQRMPIDAQTGCSFTTLSIRLSNSGPGTAAIRFDEVAKQFSLRFIASFIDENIQTRIKALHQEMNQILTKNQCRSDLEEREVVKDYFML
jgi:hypothetical protein